ncbi:MAG TPA: transcriptional repressor [Terriglobales bacterium]
MLTIDTFRERCRQQGIPLTHQREAIFGALLSLGGHPTLEEVFAAAKAIDPTLSLATVYNNVRRFLDAGLIREMNPVHGGMRIEANADPHHHAICTRCQRVVDMPEMPFAPPVPTGFTVNRINVDVFGLCADCNKSNSYPKEN